MTKTRRPECAQSLAARSRLDDLTDPLDADLRSWWPDGADEYRRQVRVLAVWILASLHDAPSADRFKRNDFSRRFDVHDRMAGDALWWLEDLGCIEHDRENSPYYRRAV